MYTPQNRKTSVNADSMTPCVERGKPFTKLVPICLYMGFTLRRTIRPEIQNVGSEKSELAESRSNRCRQLV